MMFVLFSALALQLKVYTALVHGVLHRQDNKSTCCVQRTQRNIQIAHSSNSDKWTVLALDLAALLAPVTSALVEETKAIQFCANMLVRGAFTADDSYTQQVSWVLGPMFPTA